MLQLVPRNQRDYGRYKHVHERSHAALPEAGQAFVGADLLGAIPDT